MKTPAVALSLAVAAALVAAPTASAHAAPAASKAPVTIKTIAKKTVSFERKVTIKPAYSATKGTKVDSATFTVKKGSRTVAKNARSASLGAGSYSVATTVTYRVLEDVTKQVTTQQPYRAGEQVPVSCTVTSTDAVENVFVASCVPQRDDKTAGDDGDRFFYRGTYASEGATAQLVYGSAIVTMPTEQVIGSTTGATLPAPRDFTTTHAVTTTEVVRELGATKTATKSQKLTVASRKQPKNCASVANYRSVKAGFNEKKLRGTGDSVKAVAKKLRGTGKRFDRFTEEGRVFEARIYKTCAATAGILVGYIDGRAFLKDYGTDAPR